ncbi:MAG: transcription termination/antitermination protein NusA [Polyangiaceae bacterium]|nr:transcription termination/antitermination protein NusA [Polyangiaceae bacterium]
MESHLGPALDMAAKEKGIDRKVLVETIEAAILKAAQSVFGAGRELEARFNDDTGQVDLFLYMTVVEDVQNPEREIDLEEVTGRGLEATLGEDLGFQIFWHPLDAHRAKEQDAQYGDLLEISQARSQFGRIAAQTAKQVLVARVRDAERDIIFAEYKDRVGELIKGIVRRFEKGNNIIVDLGKTEGVLPAREQTPRESYRPGDRIVALVKTIDREARGPQVILSRQDPRLVEKLFEAEVPEIYETIVRVVGVAREPGARSKIAVTSRDSDVDPVGACVGMKGSRVQAVVQELRGEKIDIVPWDKDPAKFVIAAVQPAEVHRVILDDSDRRMELVVPDEKLSLAIGRKGQNVRLASILTGWKLDIISQSRFRQIEDDALKALQVIPGADDALARAMYRAGFRTADEIADATVEELAAVAGLEDPEAAERARRGGAEAVEIARLAAVEAIKTKEEPITDRERLGLLRGVGAGTVDALVEAGFGSPEAVAREDESRLSQRAGLSARKAASVKEAAEAFLATDWKEIEAARSAG